MPFILQSIFKQSRFFWGGGGWLQKLVHNIFALDSMGITSNYFVLFICQFYSVYAVRNHRSDYIFIIWDRQLLFLCLIGKNV